MTVEPACFSQDTGDPGEESIMSFGIYVAGYLIVTGGLVYGATLMHVPVHWIAAGAIVLTGIGVVTGVKTTRQKDSAN
jgi:hypothetical protein